MAKAFGKYVNSACEKGGQELVKKAKEDHKKRQESVHKDIESVSLDIAHGLSAKAKGKLSFISPNIKCVNIMSNADRRERGMPQDPTMEDYKEEVTAHA